MGANIGNHAIYFGQLTNCTKVIAYGPNPFALRLLKINILLNHLEEKIEFREYALGESNTTDTITFTSGNLGRALIEHEGGQPAAGPERVAIQIKNGDTVLKATKVDFVKIDVEGFEMHVLKGLVKTVNRCKPTLFVEVWQENRKDFDLFLAAANYKTIKSLHNGAFDLVLAEPA